MPRRIYRIFPWKTVIPNHQWCCQAVHWPTTLNSLFDVFCCVQFPMKRYLDFVHGSFTNKLEGVRPDRCVSLCVYMHVCVCLYSVPVCVCVCVCVCAYLLCLLTFDEFDTFWWKTHFWEDQGSCVASLQMQLSCLWMWTTANSVPLD